MKLAKLTGRVAFPEDVPPVMAAVTSEGCGVVELDANGVDILAPFLHDLYYSLEDTSHQITWVGVDEVDEKMIRIARGRAAKTREIHGRQDERFALALCRSRRLQCVERRMS